MLNHRSYNVNTAHLPTNGKTSMDDKKKNLLAAGLIAALSALAYSNTSGASFHFDDFHQIVNNPGVKRLGNIPRFIVDAELWSYFTVKGYRPVTLIIHTLNYALSGLDVRGWHVVNLALHVVCALLVFLVVKALLRGAGHGRTYPLALLCASAFALHPIQTQAVTYISGRAAILAAIFFLTGFHAFLRYRSIGVGEKYRLAWAALAPVCYMLGLLSKESAVSLPAVMLLYDLLFTTEKDKGLAARLRGLAPYYTAFAGVLLVYIGLRKALAGYATAPAIPYSSYEYMLSELKVLPMYLRLMSLPVNQNFDYLLPLTKTPDALVLISAVLLASIGLALYRLRRAQPLVVFFAGWFIITIAPESSFIPILDIANEHRLYLPSVGLICAALVGGYSLLGQNRSRLAYSSAVMLLAALGLLTFSRNRVYADEYTLWGDVLSKAPYNSRARLNIGTALVADKKYGEATVELKAALDMGTALPVPYIAHYNLGVCYDKTGRKDEAEREFELTLKDEPNYYEASVKLGEIFYEAGRYADSARVYEAHVKRFAGDPVAYFNLADSLMRLGRFDDARKPMEDAVAYGYEGFDARYGLALIYERAGMKYKAQRQAESAQGMAKDYTDTEKSSALLTRLKKAGGSSRL